MRSAFAKRFRFVSRRAHQRVLVAVIPQRLSGSRGKDRRSRKAAGLERRALRYSEDESSGRLGKHRDWQPTQADMLVVCSGWIL